MGAWETVGSLEEGEALVESLEDDIEKAGKREAVLVEALEGVPTHIDNGDGPECLHCYEPSPSHEAGCWAGKVQAALATVSDTAEEG